MVLSILILILIEASGNGHNYQNLPEGQSAQLNKVDEAQLTSAKIMQRTGLLILPMVTKMWLWSFKLWIEFKPVGNTVAHHLKTSVYM